MPANSQSNGLFSPKQEVLLPGNLSFQEFMDKVNKISSEKAKQKIEVLSINEQYNEFKQLKQLNILEALTNYLNATSHCKSSHIDGCIALDTSFQIKTLEDLTEKIKVFYLGAEKYASFLLDLEEEGKKLPFDFWIFELTKLRGFYHNCAVGEKNSFDLGPEENQEFEYQFLLKLQVAINLKLIEKTDKIKAKILADCRQDAFADMKKEIEDMYKLYREYNDVKSTSINIPTQV